MSDSTLRSQLIRLAHAKPELRPHLLPLLAPIWKQADSSGTFEDAIKGMKFRNPNTGNEVAFKSLPAAEQKKLRSQWGAWNSKGKRDNPKKKDNSNADLKGQSFKGHDFIEENFKGSILEGANFHGAVLEGSDLSRVKAKGGMFAATAMRKVKAVGSDFTNADFRAADLQGSDFTRSNLKGADFTAAQLTDVNLEGAKWDSTTKWPEGFKPPSKGKDEKKAPAKTKPSTRRVPASVEPIMDKYSLKEEDAEEVRKFRSEKPDTKVPVPPSVLKQRFLAKASPETRERMKDMAVGDFMKMLKAILSDEEGA